MDACSRRGARGIGGVIALGAAVLSLLSLLAAGCDGDDEASSSGPTTGSGGSTQATGGGGAGASGGAGTGGAGQGGAGGGSTGSGGSVTCGSPDVAPSPESCAAGAPGAGDDCGPGAAASCCGSRLVPCGTFMPSYDGMTYGVPTPEAKVSDFRLDTFEITVGRFRAFVEAGKGVQADPPELAAGQHPHLVGTGWNPAWNGYLATNTGDLADRLHCNSTHATWTDAPGPNEHKPINCISWYEAFAFCAWDGGRLPTEVEWNYAATGGAEQRAYPWGTGIDDTRAVYGCLQGNCDASFILEVGAKSPAGDGLWGHSDLAGSMTEWTLDWYGPEYTEGCVDCANVLTGTERVVRGGSFVQGPNLLLASFRDKVLPVSNVNASRYRHVGARCARDP